MPAGLSRAGLSAPQVRKDTVTQRKDLRRQSFSTLRLQNQDQLLRTSTTPTSEPYKQDLKFR